EQPECILERAPRKLPISITQSEIAESKMGEFEPRIEIERLLKRSARFRPAAELYEHHRTHVARRCVELVAFDPAIAPGLGFAERAAICERAHQQPKAPLVGPVSCECSLQQFRRFRV